MRIKRIVLYLVLVFIIFAINFYLRPISGNKLVTEKYKNSSAYINDLYMSDEYFKKKMILTYIMVPRMRRVKNAVPPALLYCWGNIYFVVKILIFHFSCNIILAI